MASPAHENVPSLAPSADNDASRTKQMLVWGKDLSEKDVEEVLEQRKLWLQEKQTKLAFFAHSLELSDAEFDDALKSLNAFRAEEKAKKVAAEKAAEKAAKEKTEMMALAKQEALKKMQAAVERKEKEKEQARLELINKSAPQAAPTSALSSVHNDPNCRCMSALLHPGKPCPEFVKQAKDAKRQESKKRAAQGAPNGQPAQKKGPFQPCVGDWKCGCCGVWNMKFWDHCRGKLAGTMEQCPSSREDTKYTHHVQAAGDNVPYHQGGKYAGDWWCGNCDWWNRWHYKGCSRCGEHVDDVSEYWASNDGLPEAKRKESENPRNDWGPDNQKTINQSSQEMRWKKYVTSKRK